MPQESKSAAPRWLEWAREIQALAQTGLHYSETEYHRQRYHRLTEIAAEISGEAGGLDPQTALVAFLGQPGYATPKVDVRGAIVRDGKILLVQERADQRWCLPGGWADVGETPAEMVIREVWEESGLRVEPVRLVGVFDANRTGTPLEFFHAYKLIFLCEVREGVPEPGEETLAARFFGPDEIPPLSEQRTGRRHLERIWDFVSQSNPVAYFE